MTDETIIIIVHDEEHYDFESALYVLVILTELFSLLQVLTICPTDKVDIILSKH